MAASRDPAPAPHTRQPAASLATLASCALAMTGFAANSLLARGALSPPAIDAASYTLVRLASGALTLVLLVLASGQGTSPARSSSHAGGRWTGAVALAAYAAAFSYSYLRIGAALGALLLFPTVKLALLLDGHRRGERPAGREWAGAALGLAGLVVLTAPGVSRPDLPGVGLMVVAGLAWAVYTMAGQGVSAPVVATRDNFARATVVALPLLLPAVAWGDASPHGVLLAAVSGAVTSALSYALWYRVVPRLTGMQLGLAQLAVPVLAALGASLVLREAITARLVTAAALIAAGVLVAVWRRR
jgi:drug/metabolite transporter (DMT)-like permease